MFEQAFKRVDDVLRNEAGCTTELDYTEQTSWLLFLKCLDSMEQDRADEAEMSGKKYSFILDAPYRWETWAAPKTPLGVVDHNKAMSGDDLRDFVNGKLFPYLHGFKQNCTFRNFFLFSPRPIRLSQLLQLPNLCESSSGATRPLRNASATSTYP